jgi:hypothetical protein
LDKVQKLEKIAVAKASEYHKLQTQNKALKSKIKELENPDFSHLNNLLKDKQRELDEMALLLSSTKAEKDKEVSLLKQKNARLIKELNNTKPLAVKLSKTSKVYN